MKFDKPKLPISTSSSRNKRVFVVQRPLNTTKKRHSVRGCLYNLTYNRVIKKLDFFSSSVHIMSWTFLKFQKVCLTDLWRSWKKYIYYGNILMLGEIWLALTMSKSKYVIGRATGQNFVVLLLQLLIDEGKERIRDHAENWNLMDPFCFENCDTWNQHRWYIGDGAKENKAGGESLVTYTHRFRQCFNILRDLNECVPDTAAIFLVPS